MTMNNHWGYNKNDDHWKSSTTLIRNLIDCSSKGGNYLLNIGPTSEGLFPDASIERLAEIGKWMKANSESIYGTLASPFEQLAWGRCTQKQMAGGVTRLYLHVYDWPKGGKLVLRGKVGRCGRHARIGRHDQRLSITPAVGRQLDGVLAGQREPSFRLLARGLPRNRVVGQGVLDVRQQRTEVAEGENFRRRVAQVPGEAVQASVFREHRGWCEPVGGHVREQRRRRL